MIATSMNPSPATAGPEASPRRIGAGWRACLLLGVAGLHFFLATRNWEAGFMPGHEFRQAHTAIISRYIDREDNFRPIYTVPLFGKPWVCPMEFPLYEWSVVGLSRATGWTHIMAARAVSLACFYLMLPALWLLLGQAGVGRRQRWLPLVLTLCCPVYIFYSRSFLMESMTLMLGAWFLALFVLTMRERRFRWAALCALAGAGSGLIKSTTFFAWLLPAAAYGGWSVWRDWRSRAGGAAIARTIAWGVGTALPSCGAVWWWVKYSDTFKESHPSAHIFASKALSQGNFGLVDWSARFSPETWGTLFERWGEAVAPAWVVLPVIALGAMFAPAWRARVLGAFGLFLAPQVLFPFAYALQEYYFYACAVFGLAALGFVGLAVAESRRPAPLRVIAMLVLPLVLLGNYRRVYFDLQAVPSLGGTGLTSSLRTFTPPESVLVVIGDDWAPMIPYYSDRKALMVRRGLEHDLAYLRRAFDDLAGEEVGALVMVRETRGNAGLVQWVTRRLDLDERPTFSHPIADVYLARRHRAAALALLHASVARGSAPDGITTDQHAGEVAPTTDQELDVPPALAAAAFAMVQPAPLKYRGTYGYAHWNFRSGVLGAHPETDLWVPRPAGAREVEWHFGILPTAYEREGQKTNGVEFILVAETVQGIRRELFRRVLDPVTRVQDRGPQRAVIPCDEPGDRLIFMTRPNGDIGFDWAYFERIEVR